MAFLNKTGPEQSGHRSRLNPQKQKMHHAPITASVAESENCDARAKAGTMSTNAAR